MRSDETRATGHQDPRPPKIHDAQDRCRTSRPCRTSSPFPAPNARLRSWWRGRDRNIGGSGPRGRHGRIRDPRRRPLTGPWFREPPALRAGLIAGALTLVLRLVGVVAGPIAVAAALVADRVPPRPGVLGRPLPRSRPRRYWAGCRCWAGCPSSGRSVDVEGILLAVAVGVAVAYQVGASPVGAARSQPDHARRSCSRVLVGRGRGALVGDPVPAAFRGRAVAAAASGLGQPDAPQLPQLEHQAGKLRDRAARRRRRASSTTRGSTRRAGTRRGRSWPGSGTAIRRRGRVRSSTSTPSPSC